MRVERIATVVGARPQFIKAAPVSRALAPAFEEVLVHTGQHFDHGMSQVFFEELELRPPDYDLGAGGGSHAEQTGKMLIEIEKVLLRVRPDLVLVYGDTNSTLAGALAAAKLHLPVAHVEAGLRSFNRAMPEEVNRVVADHLSDLLFCPTKTAVDNLGQEGLRTGVHLVGDVMVDALVHNLALARRRSTVLQDLGLEPKGYALATVHRAANTDDPANMRAILEALGALPDRVVFPVHPRTRKLLDGYGLGMPASVTAVEPVGYLDMLVLQGNAACVLTDSGGMQKEAYLLGVRCITLREETEWVETVEAGWNLLTGAHAERILEAYRNWFPAGERPEAYGDGHAAERIRDLLAGTR